MEMHGTRKKRTSQPKYVLISIRKMKKILDNMTDLRSDARMATKEERTESCDPCNANPKCVHMEQEV